MTHGLRERPFLVGIDKIVEVAKTAETSDGGEAACEAAATATAEVIMTHCATAVSPMI